MILEMTMSTFSAHFVRLVERVTGDLKLRDGCATRVNTVTVAASMGLAQIALEESIRAAQARRGSRAA